VKVLRWWQRAYQIGGACWQIRHIRERLPIDTIDLERSLCTRVAEVRPDLAA
jgi:hypothetical protein